MKKKYLIFIAALIALCLALPVFACAAGAINTAESLDCSILLSRDGTAYVEETWQVAYLGENEYFEREIPLKDHESLLGDKPGVAQIFVTADEEKLTEGDDGFTTRQSEEGVVVSIRPAFAKGTHTFVIRYLQPGAVKSYRDEAVFRCMIFSAGNRIRCRSLRVAVTPPAAVGQTDFSVTDAGSIIVSYLDGIPVLSDTSTAGGRSALLHLPLKDFDNGALTVIADDYTGAYVAAGVAAAALIVAIVWIVRSRKTFMRRFRRFYDRRADRGAQEGDQSREAYAEVFRRSAPAEILFAVCDPPHPTDLLTVTLLDLMARGFVSLDKDGFHASDSSKGDPVRRPLSEAERIVIALCASGDVMDLIRDAGALRAQTDAVAKALPRPPRIRAFCSPRLRRKYTRMFAIRIAARDADFVPPQAISDGIVRRVRYDVYDLLISLIKESARSVGKNKAVYEKKYYAGDMFRFREVQDKTEPQKKERRKNKRKTK